MSFEEKYMKKLWNIACGWWFLITNRNNKLAQRRLSICATCEFRKWFVCSECGCPLQAKTRIPEEYCPRLFWGKSYINGGFTGSGK